MAETQAPIEEVEARVRFFIAAPPGRDILSEDDLTRILGEFHRREQQVVVLRRVLAMKWVGIGTWLIGAFLWGRFSA